MNLIECPRDAMQGLHEFVPTDLKIRYLNALLQVGFHTLDFGSFVSPKAIPQLADTADVLASLDLSQTQTRLLAIVANVRGAEQALTHPEIDFLGFPLSVSETFQQRNTNKSIAQGFAEVAQLQNLCEQAKKTLVVYLSMGFGNPYGDPYTPTLVAQSTQQLADLGIRIIAPSDTVGTSTPDAIESLFGQLQTSFPTIEFGAHLHARPGEARAKMEACLRAGVRRIDGALRGFGGCPMAADDLTGNLPTEEIIQIISPDAVAGLNRLALDNALAISEEVFGHTADR